MVRITVRFLSTVRLLSGTAGAELTFSSNILGDVILEIIERYHIRDAILTEEGRVRSWARVLVNGRSQEFVGGMGLVLSDGDRIVLVYPYAEAF